MATKKKPVPAETKPTTEVTPDTNPETKPTTEVTPEAKDTTVPTPKRNTVGANVLVKLPPEFRLEGTFPGIITRLHPPAVTVFIPGNELYFSTFAHIVAPESAT